MKNVIFIAPPVAGKGTQSSRLVEMGYNHISTGNMLRDEMKKESEIGKSITHLMNSGSLVSDEIVFELIVNKLKTINRPFILDGYPRTYKQAVMLDELLHDLDIVDYEVIYLDIELEEALKRALGRLTCECGLTYNIYFEGLKPKKENICDKCGKLLIRRNDDNEETFRKRFATFLENNAPIIDFYKNNNKLHIIDTKIGDENITDKVKEILK